MELTFGTGIFWIVIAGIVGDTLVGVVRGARRRGKEGKAVAALERRLAELEARLEAQTQLAEAQASTVARLEEQVDFAERLLAERATNPAALRAAVGPDRPAAPGRELRAPVGAVGPPPDAPA